MYQSGNQKKSLKNGEAKESKATRTQTKFSNILNCGKFCNTKAAAHLGSLPVLFAHIQASSSSFPDLNLIYLILSFPHILPHNSAQHLFLLSAIHADNLFLTELRHLFFLTESLSVSPVCPNLLWQMQNHL